MTDDRTCKECSEVFNDPEQTRRHLRKHGITFQQYSLRWNYNNVVPACKCGCGQETAWNVASKGYAEFVLGHHAWGRKKSDEEKRKIGEKNSANMKRFYIEHPALGKQKSDLLRAHHTSESEDRRKQTLRRTYENMSDEWRKRCSDRAITLLAQNKIGPRAPFKQMWFDNPFSGKTEFMHSSRETAFLTKCIREGYPVTKEHGIVIDYQQADGTWHRYLPDFKALEENVLFEVKGNLTPNDELKLSAAEVQGYEMVLVRLEDCDEG